VGRAVRLAALVAFGLALVAAAGSRGESAAPRPAAPRFDPSGASEVPTAVARVGPAVVGLRARIPPDRPSAATLGVERWGSGILVDPDGTAVTVGYVVLEATALEAVLRDGRTVPARVLGHDFESGLALLRLAGGGAYPAATVGRSGPVAPGQPASIVGMTEDGRLTAVPASVTAIRRFVAYWEYLLERALIVAPSHPAFGGAALVDSDGALIGVVSLRLDREHLAIPIDLLPPVRDAVVTRGRPDRPPRSWLGVRAVAVEGGVGIAGVSPAGPAHAAGLRHGDIVVRFNGDRVADVEDFYRKLWRVGVGGAIELTVLRDGRLETITVKTRDRHAVFQFRSPE